jgi:integrase
MAKPLTDSVVSNLKPQRGQSGWTETSDAGCRGLCLRVSPRGEKVWAVRLAVAGRRQRHTIGAYPAVKLTTARERARDYLAAARDGANADHVDARIRAETLTVGQAHDEYLASAGTGLRVSTRGLKIGMFHVHIAPVIGSRLIRTVRRADISEVVGAVAAKGFPVQANRVFAELMALLRWCEQKSYIDGVPSIRRRDLRSSGAAKEQPRRRTLIDAEIGEVWRAAGELGDATGDFLRLLLLLGQRRDETRLMRSEEVDLDAALWTIPVERYKTGLAHVVPLPAPALAIIRRRIQGRSGFILSGRQPGQPFHGAASALRRLRAKMPNRAGFTLHDLRRTLRSGLSRLGIEEATAELVIGHVPQGIVRVYDTHDRLDERRAALERWARHVVAVADPTDNVVALARA